MAKYYRFIYYGGYCGSQKEAVYKFPDNITEINVKDAANDWRDSQREDSVEFEEITKEEAENEGIDEDLED